MHGAEHVISLFFKDVAKLRPLQRLIKISWWLYNLFGSGTRQGPHALFMKVLQEYHGRRMVLLRPAKTRMVSLFIGMLRNHCQVKVILKVINSPEFLTMDTAKFDALCSILCRPLFCDAQEIILWAFFPMFELLKLGDSNHPGM